MPDGRIKIVFEPTDEEGLYKVVCIEDDNGNVLKGAWQDTRPWSREHRVRIILADDSDAPEPDVHKIMVGDEDVSEAMWKRPPG